MNHPAFTNNFLQLTGNDLAVLYEESILENHHLELTHILLHVHVPKLSENLLNLGPNVPWSCMMFSSSTDNINLISLDEYYNQQLFVWPGNMLYLGPTDVGFGYNC